MKIWKHRPMILAVIVLLLLNALAFSIANGQDGPEWDYEENGPDVWGGLSEDWALCGEGMAQSPIDISDATPVSLSALTFNYEAAPLAIFNNGHTIEVEYHEGSSVLYNAKTYHVLQFHFHAGSEHTINGEQYPMELHIVHRDANSGNLLVIGVLLAEGEEDNAAYADIFANLPAEEGEPNEETELMVNVADLLPENPDAFYTYEGSLTTPPCSEIVRWIVMEQPVTLSSGQLDAFYAIYPNNFRPTQPLNGRDLFVNE